MYKKILHIRHTSKGVYICVYTNATLNTESDTDRPALPLHDARPILLATGQLDYNAIRPHSALGNLAPETYAKLSAAAMQRGRALELSVGTAPNPVAQPAQMGSNGERTLPIHG